jgi:Tol biopolymer transport system component
MRLPMVPLLIAATILAAIVYLFNASGGGARRTLEAPQIARLGDVNGVETEVAISPDGTRCAVVADGDLWMLETSGGSSTRLTTSPEPESFPAWSPDGRRLTFTRGPDTFAIDTSVPSSDAQPFRPNATNLSWSASGRLVYVRDRALWLTDVGGLNERQLVAADENPNVFYHAPRFSPDSRQIAFIKSLLNLSGQVWLVDALNSNAHALIADRAVENPMDVAWILDGSELAYLTDRSGAYSIWHVDFASNLLLPLTQPLFEVLLAPVGMSVWKDRIVLPRHIVDINIQTSDGKPVAFSDGMEIEPAASRDGRLVAYTVVKGNKSEIWTSAVDGSNPTARALGHEPRFAADGLHVIYTNADLAGNADLWRLDTRNGETERITDADEIDVTPDASADGRWLAFASTRGVSPSIWIEPASGGKRLRINDGGYAPRYSEDSKTILFWNRGSLWTMGVDGSGISQLSFRGPESIPLVGGWAQHFPAYVSGSRILSVNGNVLFQADRPLWPRFDVLPDSRFLLSAIDVRETAVWAVDLQFKTQ